METKGSMADVFLLTLLFFLVCLALGLPPWFLEYRFRNRQEFMSLLLVALVVLVDLGIGEVSLRFW